MFLPWSFLYPLEAELYFFSCLLFLSFFLCVSTRFHVFCTLWWLRVYASWASLRHNRSSFPNPYCLFCRTRAESGGGLSHVEWNKLKWFYCYSMTITIKPSYPCFLPPHKPRRICLDNYNPVQWNNMILESM